MFIPSTPVSEIFGGHISRRNTTREGPFTGEDSLTGWGGGRAPGTSWAHHLPQEQEAVRPPRQQDDRWQDSDPSVQGQSLYIIFYALDWLVCFRAILNSMGAIISLFSLVSIFKTCVYILICFRFIWKQHGGGSLLSLVLKN